MLEVFNIKYKNIIIFILVFTLMFNFIIIPKKVNANPLVIPLAAKYGAVKASQLIVFILAAATAGVTFDAVEEAEKVLDKWQLDSNNWEPPTPEPNKWLDALKKLAIFGTASTVFGSIIDNIKTYFQNIGAQEGINELANDSDIVAKINVNGKDYTLTKSKIDNDRYHLIFQKGIQSGGKLVIFNNNINYRYNFKIENNKLYCYVYNSNNYLLATSFPINLDSDVNNDDNVPFEFIKGTEYNVKSDSIILTNKDPFELPTWYQPNILDIVPTKNITTPQGINETIYQGTEEELFEDLVNTITFDDLKTSQSREPYTLTETQSGTKIKVDSSTLTPYPDIEIEPIEDTSQYQGESIGILKSIVNWLSNILKAIQTLPEKFSDMLKSILIPQPDYIKNKLLTIKTDLEYKIPIELPDEINLLKGITPIPIPDGYIDNDKVFDASYINNMAETVKEWQRWLWYILIILMGMNNGYKLIRGTDLINFKNYEGGEGK